MPKQLKTYFNSLANTLASKAESAGVFSGKGDIGRCREIISQEFFQRHVSPRFTVNLGGEIFGFPNQCSGQIDIIINHDMSATFKENALIRCAIESVIAAISIKSNLDKTQLFDALENLASIPQLDREILTTGLLSKPFDEYIASWPSLFIFAFDGMSLETCFKHMTEFYNSRQIPANRMPRAIIVNRKYALTHLHYDRPGNLNSYPLTAETIGSPLFWIIIEMAKGLSWLHGMYLDYAKYYKEAYPSKA